MSGRITIASQAEKLLSRYERNRRRRAQYKRMIRWGARFLLGPRIRKGVTRATIAGKHSVIKFPRFEQGLDLFLYGWLANRSEVTKWRSALHLDKSLPVDGYMARDLIAPVRRTYLWGLIIVMARCELITPDEYAAFSQAVNLELWSYYFSDLHVNNFGRYEGRIVCLDYGE